jgi:uncharacterized membrane protein YfcA
MPTELLLIAAGLWAGAQNALAGGGSFVTLPALILAGLDPRAANITSTIALFPGQVTTGLAGRSLVAGTEKAGFAALFAVSLIGGSVGALLLLATPPELFARLVPWLVLIATGLFAWGSFRKTKVSAAARIGAAATLGIQFLIAIYGGYFGGGIGILMLAALTLAGMAVRSAGATKNVLAAGMNASAVGVLAFSGEVDWRFALSLGAGSVAGGLGGAWALHRVNETALRVAIVLIGLALTIGLFLRPI